MTVGVGVQVKPYVVHTTFQYGGTKGKRNRLREAMLWNDPPEYYSGGWVGWVGGSNASFFPASWPLRAAP